MAYLFKGRNEKSFENSFFKALQKIYYSGNIVAPRGQETLELEHAVLEVDPLKSLIISPLRKMNWFFLLAENMYYWSGRNSTELVSHYMKGYRKFSDNNLHQGAYSPQLLEQIRHVVNSLKNDPDSRQAVITLWRPNPQQAKDIPCTISFDFKIRNNKLNMHSTMRSNDIIWGSCYDIPSFSMIQIVIAGILGIETGTLYLTAHSLHLYKDHYELALGLLDERQAGAHDLIHKIDHMFHDKYKMLKCDVESLDQHIKYMEDLYDIHHCLKSGFAGYKPKELPPFYEQFELMMQLFHTKDPDVRVYILGRLKNINSPFGYL